MGICPAALDKLRKDSTKLNETKEISLKQLVKSEELHKFPGDLTKQQDPYGNNPYLED